MIITGKRIRSLGRYFGRVPSGSRLIFAATAPVDRLATLLRVGFTKKLDEGERVLPTPGFGPISRYNALGKLLKHKDQPKETAYRQAEWHWKEWRGRYDRVDRSKIVDIPYKRYPRTYLLPPGVELSIVALEGGEKLVVGPTLKMAPESQADILHCTNLFLEIFGECQVLTRSLESYKPSVYRRLNWEVLPPGRHPWEKLKPKVDEALLGAADGTRVVAEYRIKAVNQFGPEFVAVGRAGFRGYLIFGFPSKDLFVLESAFIGNATYILGESWEYLSMLTKAEILADKLHKARLVHQGDWEAKLAQALGEEPRRNRATRPKKRRWLHAGGAGEID